MTLRTITAVAVATVALTIAGSAAATTYTITVPGTITSVGGSAGPINVGDQVTLTTTVNDNMVVTWGSTGYLVAYAMQFNLNSPDVILGTSGAQNWSITLDGFTYQANDTETDWA